MRILLIEDEANTAAAIKDSTKGRFLIDWVTTIKASQQAVERNEYDVIVLDLGLPDGDGIELCKYFRKNDITAPILVLTGRSEVENKVALLDCGADDYLTKPFAPAHVRSRVREWLLRARTRVQ